MKEKGERLAQQSIFLFYFCFQGGETLCSLLPNSGRARTSEFATKDKILGLADGLGRRRLGDLELGRVEGCQPGLGCRLCLDAVALRVACGQSACGPEGTPKSGLGSEEGSHGIGSGAASAVYMCIYLLFYVWWWKGSARATRSLGEISRWVGVS